MTILKVLSTQVRHLSRTTARKSHCLQCGARGLLRLTSRPLRRGNYCKTSRRLDRSPDGVPEEDYLIIFEHSAPGLVELVTAFTLGSEVHDQLEEAIAPFADRTAASHAEVWLESCFRGAYNGSYVYLTEETPVRPT
jgi:hypothetical protein